MDTTFEKRFDGKNTRAAVEERDRWHHSYRIPDPTAEERLKAVKKEKEVNRQKVSIFESSRDHIFEVMEAHTLPFAVKTRGREHQVVVQDGAFVFWLCDGNDASTEVAIQDASGSSLLVAMTHYEEGKVNDAGPKVFTDRYVDTSNRHSPPELTELVSNYLLDFADSAHYTARVVSGKELAMLVRQAAEYEQKEGRKAERKRH